MIGIAEDVFSMPLLTAFAALLSIIKVFDFAPLLTEWSSPFHKFCVEHAPVQSHWSSYYQAMVCGESLNSGPTYDLFRRSGLLHLLVVSGAHLVFLNRMMVPVIGKGGVRSWLATLTLLIYVLVCGCNPPVFRAFLQLLCQLGSSRWRWRWTGLECSLAAGLMGLSLCPSWILSWSFLLSWCSSLAVQLDLGKGFKEHVRIYIFLLIPVASLALPHPISIFLNWLVAPLLGQILFPICLFCFFVPQLSVLGDQLWRGLHFLLMQVDHLIYRAGALPEPLAWLWIYIAVLHIGFYHWQTAERRKA